MVGAPYFKRNLNVLKRDGRLVIVAFLEGSVGEQDLMPIMIKRLIVTGSTMRPRTVAEKQALRDALRTNIWPALESGTIQTHVHAQFALSDAAEAHRLMESSQHIGKIVLQVKP
jgi:NADPH2:quinone reductase